MALSKIIKIGNGVTRQFAVSFELGYLNEDDITAQVGNEVDGLGDPIYRNITFLTPELLEIDGAVPANLETITFVRTVPSDLLLVDYEDGDIINDENMNTSQKQALMLIHQLLDGRFEKFDSGFDMGGYVITGLGVPVEDSDAVRKDYVDDLVGGTEAARIAAEASANAAAGSAASAAAQVPLATAQVAAATVLRDDTQDIHDLTLDLYDSFDDRYLGAKAAAPTLDNDGNALLTGALYYKTTAPIGMYVWSGSAWSITSGGALLSANNLSDLANLPTARRNAMRRVVSVKSANYTATLDDIGNVIANTGATAWTLSLPAAASAGNGFCFTVKNVPAGAKITVDPDASETVNGLTTLGVYGGDSVELICDGTNWYGMFQSPLSIVQTETLATARSTIEMALPTEFSTFDLRLEGFEPTVAATLAMRMSIDNGASYYANSGAYYWQQGYANGATGSPLNYNSASGGSSFSSTGIELSAGQQAVQGGALNLIDIQVSKRGASRYPGVKWTGAFGSGYVNSGQGSLGVNTGDFTNIRLLYNSGNIGSTAKYTLVGRR